ncbi:MAG: extracellular solute-binding protein, partial [Rhodothermales bacterium]|nr:extracellular solute-binding protein [Rhodothermales bacterium]
MNGRDWVIKRKGVAAVGIVLMVVITMQAVTLLGCQSASDASRTQLTFWHSFVSATIPALEELIEQFEAEHPEIDVRAQYVPTGDGLVQKLVAAVQSRTAPDIAWIHTDFLDKLVLADAIYPMRTFIDRSDGLTEEELADFYPGLLQNASWRDTLYALPMEATSLALVYNKDLFRNAGLDPGRPPATWDELATFAQRLTRDSDGDGRTEQFG